MHIGIHISYKYIYIVITDVTLQFPGIPHGNSTRSRRSIRPLFSGLALTAVLGIHGKFIRFYIDHEMLDTPTNLLGDPWGS